MRVALSSVYPQCVPKLPFGAYADLGVDVLAVRFNGAAGNVEFVLHLRDGFSLGNS